MGENIVATANRAALVQQALAVPGEVRSFIASEAVASQRVQGLERIHSIAAIPCSHAVDGGSGVHTYTLSKIDSIAFGFGLSEKMDVAGLAGIVANPSHTNMLKASQLPPGTEMDIVGIELRSSPTNDGILLQALMRLAFVDVVRNGVPFRRLGPLGRLLDVSGQVPTKLTMPPLYAEVPEPIAFPRRSYSPPLPFVAIDPIHWGTAETTDANLSVVLSLPADVAIDAPADRVAAAGVAGYAFPAPADSLDLAQIFEVVLWGRSSAKRTKNAER